MADLNNSTLTITEMLTNRLLVCSFFLMAAAALTGQPADFSPSAGFSFNLGIGKAFADGSNVTNGEALSLELQYQHPVSYRFSLVGGVGLQRRESEAVTASGEPCFFPLGIKVSTFVNNERYTTRSSVAFAKLGAAYRFGRFRAGLSALPAYRLGGDVNYVFLRDFSQPGRPDAIINETVGNGDTVDRSAVGGGSREILIDKISLQGEVSIGYTFADRLWIGLAYRPDLTRNDLNYVDRFPCSSEPCPEFFPETETAGSLKANTVLFQAGFQF